MFVRLHCFVRVVESLDGLQPLVVPGCDVISHVTSQHAGEDHYRNSTRFFASPARSPPSLPSRDHRVFDDVTASRDPMNDVIPAAAAAWSTFRLVLVCLDVVVLLYRVCHVCRAVDRMRNCWSRDATDRKYYCYYDDDDDDDGDYSSAARMTSSEQRVKRNVAALNAAGHLDETEYQLPVTSSQSSSSSSSSRPVCRLLRSSVVAKLVLFAGLLTSCHVTLQLIDSCWRISAHKATLATVSPPPDAGLVSLDLDLERTYRRDRDVTMMTSSQTAA